MDVKTPKVQAQATPAEAPKQLREVQKLARPNVPAVIVGVVIAGIAGLSIWYLVRPVPLLVQGEVDATRLDIAARVDGRVADIPVVRGQNVDQGAVLVKIDNPELVAKLHESEAAKGVAELVSPFPARPGRGRIGFPRRSHRARKSRLGWLHQRHDAFTRVRWSRRQPLPALVRSPAMYTLEAATLADTLDGLGASLFVVDAAGRIIHANASGRAMLQ